MKKEVINENCERVIRFSVEKDSKLTDSQKNMIEEACKKPYTYDEDCPPLDSELLEIVDRKIEELKNNRKLIYA